MSRPRNLLAGRHRQMGKIFGKKLDPTTVNLGILGSGILLGLVSYQYRESPIGATLLGAAGSVSAIGLVFLLRDLLIGPGKHGLAV